MINFTLKTTLGGNEDIIGKIVIGTENGGKYSDVFELLSSSSLTNSILLDSAEGVDFPFLVCDRNDIDVTSIYKLFQRFDFNTDNDMIRKMSDKLIPIQNGMFTLEVLISLQKVCGAFSRYLEGERVKIKIPMNWYNNALRTSTLVKKINDSGRASTMYIEGENKTILRKQEDDELFIMVPDYITLKIQNINVQPHSIARPYFYGKFGEDRDLEVSMKSHRFREYLKDPINLEDIIGDPKNNDLDILPSEERYRKSLIELMNNGIAKEYPDKTLEECVKNNVGSKTILTYIRGLIMSAAIMNWSHSGMLPIGKDIDPDDDDDDSNSSAKSGDEIVSNNSFERIGDTVTDGEYIINRLVDTEFSKDIYSVIDLLIRMLRFGKNKPTRIKLTDSADGTKRYIDLTTLKYYSNSGNFSAVDILEDEDGFNLFPLYSIKLNSYIKDNAYIKKNNIKQSSLDLNVGVVCERLFKGDSFRQKIVMSYIDLIKAYESGEKYCKIKGFSLEDGKIKIDENVMRTLESRTMSTHEAIDNVLSTENGEYQFYCYSGFKDSFMVKSCFDTKLNCLRTINETLESSDLSILYACSYDSIEELDDKCRNYALPPRVCISNNIARFLIPIVCQVAYLQEVSSMNGVNSSVEDTIYTFARVMKESGFIGTFGMEEKAEIAKSESFVTKESKSESSFLENVIVEVPKDYKFAKLVLEKEMILKIQPKFPDLKILEVDSNTGESVVGLLAFSPTDKKAPKIFVNPSESISGVTAKLNFKTACPGLMGILAKSIKGESPSNKFDSEDSGVYYCRLGNQVFVRLIG